MVLCVEEGVASFLSSQSGIIDVSWNVRDTYSFMPNTSDIVVLRLPEVGTYLVQSGGSCLIFPVPILGFTGNHT